MFQKPFYKVASFTIGVAAARLYMKILNYRKLADDNERKQVYPFLDRLHHSSCLHGLMLAAGLGLIAMNLLIGHSAIAAPYSWSMAANVAYYTLTRPSYVIGVFLVLFVFFSGGFTFGKEFLGLPVFRVLGKLCYEAALITPLMIQLIYS